MKKQLVILCCLWFAAHSVAAERVLRVYNWVDYLPPLVIEQFTAETGITVDYSTYTSNEEMLETLRSLQQPSNHTKPYDLVVPSNYYISRMAREDLLTRLDHEKLSNFKHLDRQLLNKAYDPDNQYSVPYLWGTTGIGVTPAVPPGSISRWADLWKPEFKDSLLLLDDMREVMGIGLLVLGYSVNDTDPVHIEQAYDKLRMLMPNVRVFDATSPKIRLLAGEVKAGMVWNGEAYIANQERPGAVTYVYPAEGVSLWIDNLAIPAQAANVADAHLLINFLLRPENAQQITEAVGYASPNLSAVKQLSPALSSNRTIYPRAADLTKAHIQQAVGEALPIYEKFWQRLMTPQTATPSP